MSTNLIKFTLVASFSFLRMDHHFDVLGFVIILSALHFKPFSVRSFILLRFNCLISDLIIRSQLRLLNHCILLVLVSAVLCCTHCNVHLRLLRSRLLSLVDIDVPLALGNDLVRSLPRLVYLFDHLLHI